MLMRPYEIFKLIFSLTNTFYFKLCDIWIILIRSCPAKKNFIAEFNKDL